MSYLDCILACRRWDRSSFRPFRIGRERVGWVRHAFARILAGHPSVFVVDAQGVALAERLDDFRSRSEAVEEVLLVLREAGDLERGYAEPFPVVRSWGDEPLMGLDRTAVPRFGVKAFGLHLNGFVRAPDGLKLWVARRSTRVRTAPGRLDHLVAGGQPLGLGLRENLVKECEEEASLPADLAARAIPTGVVAYRLETERGLRDDTIFVWDLEVPPDFEPRCGDGEVEAFDLWPVERMMETVRDDCGAFKFNVAPVIVDFLVRHGLLGPEEPGYVDIVRALHG